MQARLGAGVCLVFLMERGDLPLEPSQAVGSVRHSGKRKSGFVKTYEWKLMLMNEPEPEGRKLRKIRWEVIQSG